jgi:hypothetical protein
LNEKIFLTLYYIFAIMAVVTAYNLASWVWLIYFSSGFGYVDKMVELSAMHIFPDPELSEDLSLALDLEDIADDDMSTGLSSESSAISSLSSTSSFRHHQVSPVNSNATTCTFATNNRGQSVEFNTGQPPLMDQQQSAEQQNDEGFVQKEENPNKSPLLSSGLPSSSRRIRNSLKQRGIKRKMKLPSGKRNYSKHRTSGPISTRHTAYTNVRIMAKFKEII